MFVFNFLFTLELVCLFGFLDLNICWVVISILIYIQMFVADQNNEEVILFTDREQEQQKKNYREV